MPFSTIGSFTLYRSDPAIKRTKDVVQSWAETGEFLFAGMPESRTRHIVIRLTDSLNRLTSTEAFASVGSAIARLKTVMMAGVASDNAVVVYVKKLDTKNWPGIKFPDNVKVEYFRMLNGHVQHQQRCLTSLDASLKDTVANFVIQTSMSEKVTFEQVYAGTQRLSDADLEVLIGQIACQEVKARSPEDAAIYRCYTQLRKVRATRLGSVGATNMTWSCLFPPVPIVTSRFLLNTDMVGTRLLEQSGGQLVQYPLSRILTDTSVLLSHSLLLIGDNSSTGFGKSAFAKHVAIQWSLRRAAETGRPAGDASITFTTCLDSLRDANIMPSSALIVDEFHPDDGESIQYCSEHMMKTLMDPTASCSVRCRAKNAVIPAGVARIFTGNAASAIAWCGRRFSWSEPLQRKTIVVIVDRPLVVKNWSSHPEFVQSNP